MTKRMLVVYFSLTCGNTRRVAETLSSETGADLAEIRTTEPYGGSYEDIVDQGKDEVESGFLPEVEPLEADLDDYDVIALGSPTWWYTMAPAMRTFVESQDWAGREVIPFQTHGGWPGHLIDDVEGACAGAGFRDEMSVQFDSTGGDQMVTPEREVVAWARSIAKTLS